LYRQYAATRKRPRPIQTRLPGRRHYVLAVPAYVSASKIFLFLFSLKKREFNLVLARCGGGWESKHILSCDAVRRKRGVPISRVIIVNPIRVLLSQLIALSFPPSSLPAAPRPSYITRAYRILHLVALKKRSSHTCTCTHTSSEIVFSSSWNPKVCNLLLSAVIFFEFNSSSMYIGFTPTDSLLV
jgi:hypothetical protein